MYLKQKMVGYYSGFYISLNEEKRGNGEFVKNEKGHFGEKWQFLQTLSTKRWVQKLSKCCKIWHAVVFHVYKEI